MRWFLLKVAAMMVLLALSVPAILVGLTVSHKPCRIYVPPRNRLEQGCVNQGNDRRLFAPVVCWLQQHLSWESSHLPHFYILGAANRTHCGVAWPPYVVYNVPDGKGHWRMFRAGFRYDRTWKGYIFPTLAYKCISHPLTY